MLHELQVAFARSVVDGRGDRVAQALLAGGVERLAIYRNNFLGALTNALRLNFPAVERLVGRDFFEGAAGRFAQLHPPQRADLNTYGAEFPAFLAALPAAQGLPYLPGVARLDWAYAQALNGPDAAPVDLAALAKLPAVDGAAIRLALHPCVHLLKEDLPVEAIWRAVLSGDEAALTAIELMPARHFLLVERPLMDVNVENLSKTDWAFLAALHAGQSLASALESFGESAPQCLARHLAAGRLIAPELHQKGVSR